MEDEGGKKETSHKKQKKEIPLEIEKGKEKKNAHTHTIKNPLLEIPNYLFIGGVVIRWKHSVHSKLYIEKSWKFK